MLLSVIPLIQHGRQHLRLMVRRNYDTDAEPMLTWIFLGLSRVEYFNDPIPQDCSGHDVFCNALSEVVCSILSEVFGQVLNSIFYFAGQLS